MSINSFYFHIRSINTVILKKESCCFLSFTLLTFRLDPPGQAISMATQELLRLAEANPGGLASLDPVNDLQLKNIDVVQASMRLRVLQDNLREYNCIHSPTFPEQVGSFGVTLVKAEAVFIKNYYLYYCYFIPKYKHHVSL